VESPRVKLPVLSEMLGEIPTGSLVAVFHDGDSQWDMLLANICAEHLKAGGNLIYETYCRPPNEVRQNFQRLAVNLAEYEAKDMAVLYDGYHVQIGKKSSEKYQAETTNLNELSIASSQSAPLWPAGTLDTSANYSVLALNQENVFSRFYRKMVADWKSQEHIMIHGFVTGVHSPDFYEQLKMVSDGVVEVRLVEYQGKMIDAIRTRSFRGQRADTQMRHISFDSRMKASLQIMAR